MQKSARPVMTGARRGGRVVEGARLERVYTGNCIEGSNPSLSAIIISLAANSLRSLPARARPKSWPAALAPPGSGFKVSPEPSGNWPRSFRTLKRRMDQPPPLSGTGDRRRRQTGLPRLSAQCDRPHVSSSPTASRCCCRIGASHSLAYTGLKLPGSMTSAAMREPSETPFQVRRRFCAGALEPFPFR